MQQTAKSGPLNGHPATGIQNPWWAYLFLAGTNVLGQVLASGWLPGEITKPTEESG
jgi:hypothetical protein